MNDVDTLEEDARDLERLVMGYSPHGANATATGAQMIARAITFSARVNLAALRERLASEERFREDREADRAMVRDGLGNVSAAAELLEQAWGIIANVGGGDWAGQSDVWRGAALNFRERYLGHPGETAEDLPSLDPTE